LEGDNNMAFYYRFFGGPEGSEPEYTQVQFAEVLAEIFTNGIISGALNEFEVTENDPASMSVIAKSGRAWIKGYWCHNTSDLVKTLGAADPDDDRIDRIVLRLDTVTELKISVEVLEGTPAGSPSAPSLTQTSSTWEISLAQVLVEAAVTSVANADITDEREYAAVSGLTDYALDADLDEQSTITTTIASSATPTPARASIKTEYEITALSEAAEFGEPTGTPANGDLLFISVTDNGTTRALTYNAIYDDPYSAELPTDTTANLTILMLFRYSTARTKWELLFTERRHNGN